uniref:Pentatricopeptide repeat-containing protein n=1 Tax=Oryza nivara TaxID=4536 RepID=A0A0E0HQA7_ORYNI
MLRAGARPDGYTLPLLNRAAASLPAHRGEAGIVGAAHAVGVRTGFAANVYFCNTLVDAYARRGMVARARKLFDEMPARDVVSWTSLVSGHAGVGDVREVSRLLSGMRVDGCEPSAVTLTVVLRACTSNEDVVGGGQLHYYAVKSGLSDNLLVLNSILMYLCRMPALDDAVALFKQSPRREAISWNIMISEYSSEGNISKVAEMYQRMRREEVCPSCQTLTTVVAAFAKCKIQRHRQLHMVSHELELHLLLAVYRSNTFVWANVKFYICSSVDMLQGLVISYRELGALRLGKATHGYMIRNNYEAQSEKSALVTSIVKLYARLLAVGALIWLEGALTASIRKILLPGVQLLKHT